MLHIFSVIIETAKLTVENSAQTTSRLSPISYCAPRCICPNTNPTIYTLHKIYVQSIKGSAKLLIESKLVIWAEFSTLR
jgi:hypothetical protein